MGNGGADGTRTGGPVRATAMGIDELTDADLRDWLFERLYTRFQVEHDQDPATRLFNRTPIAFWASRHGSLLTIDRRADGRLLRITLEWEHRLGQPPTEPWTASVYRMPGGARVALTGSRAGTVEDVIDDIVQEFVNRTAQVE